MFSKAPRFPVQPFLPLSREEKKMNLLKTQLKKDSKTLAFRHKLFASRDPQKKEVVNKKSKTAGRTKTNAEEQQLLTRSKSVANLKRRPRQAEKTPCQEVFRKEIAQMKQEGVRFPKPCGHPLRNTTLSKFKLIRDKKFKNMDQRVSQLTNY